MYKVYYIKNNILESFLNTNIEQIVSLDSNNGMTQVITSDNAILESMQSVQNANLESMQSVQNAKISYKWGREGHYRYSEHIEGNVYLLDIMIDNLRINPNYRYFLMVERWIKKQNKQREVNGITENYIVEANFYKPLDVYNIRTCIDGQTTFIDGNINRPYIFEFNQNTFPLDLKSEYYFQSKCFAYSNGHQIFPVGRDNKSVVTLGFKIKVENDKGETFTTPILKKIKILINHNKRSISYKGV